MKELKFTCPKCGNRELKEIANVSVVFPIRSINTQDFNYGEKEDGNGMNDGIDHYECGNGCILMSKGSHIDTQEDMIEWLRENQE